MLHARPLSGWQPLLDRPAKAPAPAFARERPIADIGARPDANVRHFLLSLHDAAPEFGAIGLLQAEALPAVRWKVQNLARLKAEDPDKHAEQRSMIESLFA